MDGQFISKAHWKNLDHQVFHFLENLNLKSKKGLVCLSGGVDSMALLNSLVKVSQAAGMGGLSAVTIHHGQYENQDFRDQTLSICQEFCLKIGVPFFSDKNLDSNLTTESQLREFRWAAIHKIKMTHIGDGILFTGHHQDDAFENLFMRLWRGTGIDGLVDFGFSNGAVLRPLLNTSKKQIFEYAQSEQIPFLEDPTNSSNEPLRNFVRNELFPMMELKIPGGVDAFSRSIVNLVNQALPNTERLDDFINLKDFSISRAQFLGLEKSARKTLIAKVHLKAGLGDYSAGQIEEIVRRLDKAENEYTFSLKYGDQTKVWVIDAKRIRLNLE